MRCFLLTNLRKATLSCSLRWVGRRMVHGAVDVHIHTRTHRNQTHTHQAWSKVIVAYRVRSLFWC
jgi:hypothetical protein